MVEDEEDHRQYHNRLHAAPMGWTRTTLKVDLLVCYRSLQVELLALFACFSWTMGRKER